MEKDFPRAVEAIRREFYMDDCVSGAEDGNAAIKLAKELKYVLSQSNFELCKWKSNSERLIQELGGENTDSVYFTDGELTSVLGFKWLPKSDEFIFRVQEDELSAIATPTKRSILSAISRLFDPNGFLAPVIMQGKLLIKEIWKLNNGWDKPLQKEMVKDWTSIWSNLKHVEKVRLPRWLKIDNQVHMQLHGFADSSSKAYGCCVYLRITKADGTNEVSFIAAKSRVAPMREVQIPRLELAAAELLSKLITVVRKSMSLEEIPYFLWSDSTIALQWLNKPVHALKVYVANRVRTVQENTSIKNWRHVRSEENPADLVSRGISGDQIVNNNLWWHGPSWLMKSEEHWPKPVNVRDENWSKEALSELKSCNVFSVRLVSEELRIFVHRFGSVPLLSYSFQVNKLIRI